MRVSVLAGIFTVAAAGMLIYFAISDVNADHARLALVADLSDQSSRLSAIEEISRALLLAPFEDQPALQQRLQAQLLELGDADAALLSASTLGDAEVDLHLRGAGNATDSLTLLIQEASLLMTIQMATGAVPTANFNAVNDAARGTAGHYEQALRAFAFGSQRSIERRALRSVSGAAAIGLVIMIVFGAVFLPSLAVLPRLPWPSRIGPTNWRLW